MLGVSLLKQMSSSYFDLIPEEVGWRIVKHYVFERKRLLPFIDQIAKNNNKERLHSVDLIRKCWGCGGLLIRATHGNWEYIGFPEIVCHTSSKIWTTHYRDKTCNNLCWKLWAFNNIYNVEHFIDIDVHGYKALHNEYCQKTNNTQLRLAV